MHTSSPSFALLLLPMLSFKLIEDEPDLEPETMKHIFISKLMKLDPQALTYNGFFCFDCCFHKVNLNDFKLRQWRRTIVTDSLDLMGLEYLWEVMLNAKQDIAHKAIDCMKGIYSTLTPQLMELNVRGHRGGVEGERFGVSRGREEIDVA